MNADRLFMEYASAYDRSNGKVELKIIHTRKVAEIMDNLTMQLKLDGHMRQLAHVCAVFHDIGRFEQVKRFDTFLDGISVDHADLGCEILEEAGMLEELSDGDRKMVLTAIRNHNKYAIEEGVDEHTKLLCKLIRDADKSDIFRVFACEEMVDTMGETIEQVEQETITDCVYTCIFQHRSVDKAIRRTGLDKWVGFLGFVFDIYFDETIALLKANRYYRRPFDQANFARGETQRRVTAVLNEIERYLESRSAKANGLAGE